MTAEERLAICEVCKLVRIDPVYGPICDNTKYMNPQTGEVSRLPHAGWIRGCACRLKWKAKSPTAHCVAKKW